MVGLAGLLLVSNLLNTRRLIVLIGMSRLLDCIIKMAADPFDQLP